MIAAQSDARSGAQGDAVLDAVFLLVRARAVADERIGGMLSRVGLSLDDLGMLRAVAAVAADGETGIAAPALAAALRLAPSQAVRGLRPLEKLGWVERTADRRYRLTASGAAILAEGESIATEGGRRWLAESGVDVGALRGALCGLVTGGGAGGAAPAPHR